MGSLRWHDGRCAWVLLAGLLGASGCSSIGPGTVSRDRFNYSGSISESWKRQTLLNIVKLRYVDPPVHMEVGQIVAGYSLETEVSLGGTLGESGSSSLGFGTAGKYTDRPTITYTPMTGSRYLRTTVMPLAPDAVFFLIQAGWPADGVLLAAVASLNGLKNQETTLSGVTPAMPEFLRVLELLRQIQLSGAVAMRIEQDPRKQETMILSFYRKGITADTLEQIAELRRHLQLNPEAREFRLVFGATPANDREVAVVTRSPLQMMAMMSTWVAVPPEDIADGRATPGLPDPASARIHFSRKRPADAFTVVEYRGRWFWIDDRDLRMKRAFGLLLMLSSLGDTGQHEPLPLITIPAQ